MLTNRARNGGVGEQNDCRNQRFIKRSQQASSRIIGELKA
jgi:hypothetical protein